jgi:cytochrome bd-type quinol oxidase subunit 2
MTDHASAFRVAAPFLSVTPIQHPTCWIGGIAASVRVRSTAFRILFGSIVLMGGLMISSTTDPQGWSASREPLFLLAGMLFLVPVPLVAAGAAWMTLRQSMTEDPCKCRISGAMELLLISHIGLAIGLAPHVLPPSIAMFLAASASETQVLLPIGMMFLLPSLVAYSACSY